MSLFEYPANGPLPWNACPYSYAGWVPTISGHLSFSLIGTNDLRPHCRSFNRPTSDSKSRVVIVHQRRVAADYPFPRIITALARPAAVQHYILIANTAPAAALSQPSDQTTPMMDDQGVLTGLVLLIPQNRRAVTKKRQRAFLTSVREKLSNQASAAELVLQEILGAVREARLAGVPIFSMSTAIFRTGEFRLWYDMKQLLGREVHPGAIPPRDVEIAAAESAAPHAYYFVKDVSHRHYHHDQKSDQLLLLSRLLPVTSDRIHQENELKWRRETLWGLARVVAQFRRKKQLEDQKRARGILAYADAFQMSLARFSRPDDVTARLVEHERLSLYDFGHTRASVESLEAAVAWRQAGWMQFVAVQVGIFLSSLALWAAAIQIRPILCAPSIDRNRTSVPTCEALGHSASSEAAVWVADNPLVFISMLIVAGFATYTVFIKSNRFFGVSRWFVVGLARFSKALAASIARRSWTRLGDGADWLGYFTKVIFLAGLLALVVRIALARLL